MPTKRPSLTVNITAEVWRWYRRLQGGKSSAHTKMVTAGIMALRFLTEGERSAVIRLAGLVDDEDCTWDEFEGVCERSAKDREKASVILLEKVIQAEIEAKAAKRSKKLSGAHSA